MVEETPEPSVEQVAKRLFGAPDALVQVAIGGLLFAIPIVNLVPLGLLYRQAAGVVRGEQPEWPDWDVWSGLFGDGVRALLPVGAYGILPVLILALAVQGSPWYFLPATLSLLSVALLVAPSLAAAGVYRALREGDLAPAGVFNLAWQARGRLAVPSLAFVGAQVVGLPLLPWVAFAAWAVWLSWTSAVFFSMDKPPGKSVSAAD